MVISGNMLINLKLCGINLMKINKLTESEVLSGKVLSEKDAAFADMLSTLITLQRTQSQAQKYQTVIKISPAPIF